MSIYTRRFGNQLGHQLDHLDQLVVHWMAKYGIRLLRLSLGAIYLWFGVLKLIPGLSPVRELVSQSMAFLPIPMSVFIPILAAWEMLIGLGFITGKFTRITVILMLAQMVGTFIPVISIPEMVFTRFPFGLTMEGEFIAKNFILISSALIIGATARGGGLSDRPLT